MNLYRFHGKGSGLLDTGKFDCIIYRMSQIIRTLKLEVYMAIIYVCKAFWREIDTPAHLRHCHDSSGVKSRHLSPTVSPLSPASLGPEFQMTGA